MEKSVNLLSNTKMCMVVYTRAEELPESWNLKPDLKNLPVKVFLGFGFGLFCYSCLFDFFSRQGFPV